ncbi:hypothetical protein COEREDRAFT_87957 [Coemansia reversa NRRL 1564]|uniref:Uncharacterized protein n=1 Tax=Coemansia reversa (strain ATCC 12441 / NRRL 1564) TaxID=763665 RepID=A0A2G5B8K4_COERN|nr:hypothetical protein COEREDRAFT_87957 [Coemansia reversa NRRL 1564]|eukprot:PIA15339.1 hypothetical protein COEREDRAFT_87957 [Coemansia reversa NRRL 1564]
MLKYFTKAPENPPENTCIPIQVKVLETKKPLDDDNDNDNEKEKKRDERSKPNVFEINSEDAYDDVAVSVGDDDDNVSVADVNALEKIFDAAEEVIIAGSNGIYNGIVLLARLDLIKKYPLYLCKEDRQIWIKKIDGVPTARNFDSSPIPLEGLRRVIQYEVRGRSEEEKLKPEFVYLNYPDNIDCEDKENHEE